MIAVAVLGRPRWQRAGLEKGKAEYPLYGVDSDAFVHPFLIPLLQADVWDHEAVAGAARAVESLLASGRPAIGDLVSLRITEATGRRRSTKEHSGRWG
ncbi:hypothetical protein E0500_023480 [Streptomyces sp. KM273126]|uniref:hypothetical protein n=1 Tax=Streptomyces sp. KM273126 TaxID=2545247 RepID=UPI00103DBA6F|nr:hypothetical protein [Streptomyces sp. KM273126]MBA2810271.1 hypothetical protein [Streptomyces sp. KM273126]